MALAALVGGSVSYSNFIVPVVAMAVAISLMFYFRGKVKEIIADERDYEIGGRSAVLAIQIYAWLAVSIMFLLLAYSSLNPSPETMAIVAALAYSTCLLMIIYTLLFRYYDKIRFLEKKFIYVVIGVLLLLVLALAGLRLFSGEDNWMCQEGEWVKHGQPEAPMPTIECSR